MIDVLSGNTAIVLRVGKCAGCRMPGAYSRLGGARKGGSGCGETTVFSSHLLKRIFSSGSAPPPLVISAANSSITLGVDVYRWEAAG